MVTGNSSKRDGDIERRIRSKPSWILLTKKASKI